MLSVLMIIRAGKSKTPRATTRFNRTLVCSIAFWYLAGSLDTVSVFMASLNRPRNSFCVFCAVPVPPMMLVKVLAWAPKML